MDIKFKLICVLTLFVLLFFACKKDTKDPQFAATYTPAPIPPPPPPPPNPPVYKDYYVSDEVKSYGYFKVGSYWIYRIDTTSNATDSIYVESVTTSYSYRKQTGDTVGRWEKITVKFGPNPNYHFHPSFILNSLSGPSIQVPNLANNNIFRIFELDSMNIAPNFGGGMTENKSVSNYVLEGINYGNCRRIKYIYKYWIPSHSELWYYADCYWKKNVGLVNNFTTLIFNPCHLLRYSVVQ